MPSGSYDADASKATVSPIIGRVGASEKRATGGFGTAPTDTTIEAVSWSPSLSVTVRTTVNLPSIAYACVAVAAVAVPPSPKSHVYATIVPSGSTDEKPSKRTVSPARGDVGA